MPNLQNAATELIIGDPVPIPGDWKVQQQRRDFWWLSFDCFGPVYASGVDSDGVKIIRQHERETDDDYARRVENATPYDAAGPIIRQYNNFVFRKEPTLNISTDQFSVFNKDVDGLGTASIPFWQELLLQAQVGRESYCLIDSNNDTGLNTMTRAQADSMKLRYFWREIRASQVLWSRDYMGRMVEAAVLMQREDGRWVIWMADTKYERFINLRFRDSENCSGSVEDFEIASVDPIREHGFITLPLVRLQPKFGTVSQIASLAELQKKLARLLSLLDEELLNSTFSQWVVFGAEGPNSSGDKQTNSNEINFGNRRIMFIGNQQASMTSVGADVLQADSLRKSIHDTLTQMFKTAGIQPDALQDTAQVESGLAKQFKFNDLSANLAALSNAVERAHREAEIITLSAMNISNELEAPVEYDKDFNLPNFNKELSDTISSMNAGLPPTIAKTIAMRFADRNLGLSDDDKETLMLELEQDVRFGRPSLINPSLTDAS